MIVLLSASDVELGSLRGMVLKVNAALTTVNSRSAFVLSNLPQQAPNSLPASPTSSTWHLRMVARDYPSYARPWVSRKDEDVSLHLPSRCENFFDTRSCGGPPCEPTPPQLVRGRTASGSHDPRILFIPPLPIANHSHLKLEHFSTRGDLVCSASARSALRDANHCALQSIGMQNSSEALANRNNLHEVSLHFSSLASQMMIPCLHSRQSAVSSDSGWQCAKSCLYT